MRNTVVAVCITPVKRNPFENSSFSVATDEKNYRHEHDDSAPSMDKPMPMLLAFLDWVHIQVNWITFLLLTFQTRCVTISHYVDTRFCETHCRLGLSCYFDEKIQSMLEPSCTHSIPTACAAAERTRVHSGAGPLVTFAKCSAQVGVLYPVCQVAMTSFQSCLPCSFLYAPCTVPVIHTVF